MHECIGLAIITGKEAEALGSVEELHRAGGLLASQFTARSGSGALFNSNHITNNLQILRGNLAATINQVKFQFLTFGQTFKPGALNRADVNENIFAACFLLDKAEALLRVEEFYSALAGPDNLCGHTVTAAATRAATTTARTAAEAASATRAAATATTVSSAEAITAASEPVATATETITTETAALRFKTSRRTAERIETVFTETVPLIPSAAPPSVVTHNSSNTLVAQT